MDQYIGRLLDNRYEILECIGTGGMAVVYKARCHRLNRLVAIKILKDDFAKDEEFRRRFRAEGEAVAMLNHPNIVQIYDVSSFDTANYIVMELIEGITLKQFLEKRGVLNWKETLHFGIQIAKALEHAHGSSIVHRDIKPHNVMVLKNGSVKVTDFGIARVMSKSNTLTKEALGSVHYISPEQAKGGWVDNRSDLYSLGVVMYEMMAGRPPYDGESPVAVAIQHINGGAPMPSTLNPNIPGGLEQIIMKSMALDPKDRYSSATEMLKDMDEFRKNPAILFGAEEKGVSDETKILKTPLVTQEIAATANRQPKTTAEKVAGAAGSAGARQNRTAAGGSQSGQRAGSGAARTGSSGTRSGSASGAKPSGPDAARRAAASQKAREEMREEIRKEERNRVATIAVIACSVVAVIAIAVFLIALVNGWLLGGDATVLVPDYIGEHYEQIEELEGLSIKINSQEYNEEVEAGVVFDQKPAGGTEVAQDTVVWLTVSLGPEPEVKTMEDLTGWNKSQAESYLKGQGMVPVLIPEESAEFEPDQVIRTEPEVGDELTDGQTINVYYCTVKTVKMPDVTGRLYEVAETMLKSYGFVNIRPESVESDEPEGTVLEQSVVKDEEIPVDTEIVLTVATKKLVAMQNVVGKDYEVAKGILDGLGFTKIRKEEKPSDEKEGTVLEQSVKVNEEIALDTEIVLTVAVPMTEKVKDVTGKSFEVAKEILDGLGFTKITRAEEPSDEVEGTVLRQSVKAGSEVALDTEIILTVAVVKQAKIINVVGQQVDAAEKNLNDLGFKNVIVREIESNAEKGEVVKQSVAGGSTIAVDTEIILTVSKGPAPTEPPVTDPPAPESGVEGVTG